MARHLTELAIISLTFAAVIARAEEVDWQARRGALGRQEKLRILVDKVLSGNNNWVMTGEHMDEIRDAGFNVVVPRMGGARLGTVREHAEMAHGRGLFYMSWVNGAVYVKKGQTGARMLGANGKTASTIFSPNADEHWDWLTQLMLGQARISAEVPSVIGAFFDFEGYAMKGIPGNYFPLSYDEVILRRFARARGIELPELADDERYQWLKKEGLHEAFREFQIDSWRRRCRKLREQVDAINPAFQFIVYPIPGTLFSIEAFMPELATEKAPLLCADSASYDRTAGIGGVWLSHADGLRMNRHKLARNMNLPHIKKLPHLYMGGLDPICTGADPEFCGKNAASVSQLTNGYWVFYEGPRPETTHPAYFAWFKRANRAIENGRLDFWQEPREGPDPQTLPSGPEAKVAPNRFETDQPKLGQLGWSKPMMQYAAREGGFEVHRLESLSLRHLKRYDLVVLQNLTVDLAADDPIVKALREYVRRGGGLFLARRAGWRLSTLFPEIARRGYSRAEFKTSGAYCLDNKYVVVAKHDAIGPVEPDTRFTGGFTDHVVFEPGPSGTVVVRNIYDDPVYIVGEFGKGRVVFTGVCYKVEKQIVDPERTILLSMLDWISRPEGK